MKSKEVHLVKIHTGSMAKIVHLVRVHTGTMTKKVLLMSMMSIAGVGVRNPLQLLLPSSLHTNPHIYHVLYPFE
jgi:hypothetical protein